MKVLCLFDPYINPNLRASWTLPLFLFCHLACLSIQYCHIYTGVSWALRSVPSGSVWSAMLYEQNTSFWQPGDENGLGFQEPPNVAFLQINPFQITLSLAMLAAWPKESQCWSVGPPPNFIFVDCRLLQSCIVWDNLCMCLITMESWFDRYFSLRFDWSDMKSVAFDSANSFRHAVGSLFFFAETRVIDLAFIFWKLHCLPMAIDFASCLISSFSDKGHQETSKPGPQILAHLWSERPHPEHFTLDFCKHSH